MPETKDIQEIEITPEMVEAATRVLWVSGLLEYESQADKLIVSDMIHAGLTCEGHQVLVHSNS